MVYSMIEKINAIISAFAISQQIKEVIANGNEKLNRLMIAQTPYLLPAIIIKIG